jgi:hypothetical protein
MAEENKNPVVIRTQVYLNDTDYFCNKSWTMSYNLNTESWISFHSYIPNFYIGENNFFYSGLNGCCDDSVAGGFQAVAGVLTNRPPLTTTTTTYYPSPSTTTTTTTLSCVITGTAIITNCTLTGTGLITVPPTTTTTICQRPLYLSKMPLTIGYTLGTDPEVIFIGDSKEACDAIPIINYINGASNIDGSTLDRINGYFNTNVLDELQIGDIIYYGDSTYCTFVSDGWYIPASPAPITSVYNISGGVVTNIVDCDCMTTTTTTTMVPSVPECCGILLSSNNNIYYSDVSAVPVLNQLDVPGYVTSLGIAMTANYLWSINTSIQQWDIALSPFSATYNREISLPGGYTAGRGIVAKNDGILIAINNATSPKKVVELDITGTTAVSTIRFNLQANRTSTGNMLYTTDGKLIVINQNTITSDYYITQYNYTTGAVEVDLNIGSVAPTSLFECNCEIYITNASGNLYVVIRIIPYVLFNLGTNIGTSSIGSATQVASCIVSSITDAQITTTTTTTI